MKRIIFLVMANCFAFAVQAQTMMASGNNSFEKKWIRNGRSEMAYYAISGGSKTEICSFTIDIQSAGKTLSVYTALRFLHSNEQWLDTCISDGDSFQPIYRSSRNKDKELVLKYGKEVTGYYFDKKTQKKNTIKEAVQGSYFDNYTYPYLLGLLPLNAGYKTDLSIYDYKPGNSINIKKARIGEVKSNIYKSSLTGEHKVWQVTVFDGPAGDRQVYYIDKENRRIWKIEIWANGQQLLLIYKEIDFNPFKSRFDKEETLRMITSGTGVISGEVFARDNQAPIKGIAILNVNKKQFAKAGTSVILIPYTDYFKEWIKLNEASRKKGLSIPLAREAAECIKVTTVYDDKGSFEFVNLMPGDYLLYTEFGYVHTASRTEVIGYTDTYINGMFQGSTANTQSYSYNTNASASIKKVVTINKAGENVSVKLRKTR